MEKKKLNFGKQSQQGQPAFNTGDVVLTEGERKVLEMAGWKQGDPLPGKEFAKAVQAIKENAENEFKSEAEKLVKSNKPPVSVAVRPIDSLPQEKQNQLRSLLEKSMAKQEPSETLINDEGADPSVVKAVEELIKPNLNPKKEKPAVTIEPDTKKETPKQEDAVSSEELTKLKQCQHCGWLLDNEEGEKPTKTDAFLFVQSLLSGSPYEKEYSLLGDKLRIIYRTLPVEVSDMCLRQCALDTATEKLRTQDEFFTSLMNYRLSVSIKAIIVDKVEYEIGSSVDDHIANNKEILGKSTPLGELLPTLRSMAPLNQEPIWRLVGRAYQRFNAAISFLEARADDADFYQAIVASS